MSVGDQCRGAAGARMDVLPHGRRCSGGANRGEVLRAGDLCRISQSSGGGGLEKEGE